MTPRKPGSLGTFHVYLGEASEWSGEVREDVGLGVQAAAVTGFEFVYADCAQIAKCSGRSPSQTASAMSVQLMVFLDSRSRGRR